MTINTPHCKMYLNERREHEQLFTQRWNFIGYTGLENNTGGTTLAEARRLHLGDGGSPMPCPKIGPAAAG